MILFLRPNDTFFFRDGRPFSRGEQSEGYSLFPPFPSTVLGALRSAYIAETGDFARFCRGEMKASIGTRHSLDGAAIRIKGVFLGRIGSEIFYPVPGDLVAEKGKSDRKLYQLSCSHPDLLSNSMMDIFLTWDHPTQEVEQVANGMLERNTLRRYLRGQTSNLMYSDNNGEGFVLDEPKVGIARNRATLTSEEHMLYRIHMKRFATSENRLGLVVDCADIPFPDQGMLKLGGEGKGFTYHLSTHVVDPVGSEDTEAIRKMIEDTGLFKLYFAMPTIFDQGWLPKWIQPDSLEGEVPMPDAPALPVKLLTAAVSNYVSVGGWDLANQRPKLSYRAVPSGSVYCFELLDRTRAQELWDAFHYANISDVNAREGFGLALVGAVRRNT